LRPAPKGAVDVEDLATSLKRCPDTKPELFSGCQAIGGIARFFRAKTTEVIGAKNVVTIDVVMIDVVYNQRSSIPALLLLWVFYRWSGTSAHADV
jgi:hypothetical protein